MPPGAAVAATAELVWGELRLLSGRAVMALGAHGICWLDLAPPADGSDALHAVWPAARLIRDDKRIADAFAGAESLPLQVQGTAFQVAVWQALLNVPPGDTLSYGELARRIGRPGAARAVGSAAAANRIALLIPCHRLVPAGGGCGAFRWGAALKQRLLDEETQTGLPADARGELRAA